MHYENKIKYNTAHKSLVVWKLLVWNPILDNNIYLLSMCMKWECMRLCMMRFTE